MATFIKAQSGDLFNLEHITKIYVIEPQGSCESRKDQVVKRSYMSTSPGAWIIKARRADGEAVCLRICDSAAAVRHWMAKLEEGLRNGDRLIDLQDSPAVSTMPEIV